MKGGQQRPEGAYGGEKCTLGRSVHWGEAYAGEKRTLERSVRWGEVYAGEKRTLGRRGPGSCRGADGRSCVSSHPESILVEWERILAKGPLGSGRRGSDSQSWS